jgi:hypothetical protein
MTESNPSENPHDICTWRPLSACTGCDLSGQLKCRFSAGDLLHFLAMFAAFAIPAVAGIILSGYGWYLLGWPVQSLSLLCKRGIPPGVHRKLRVSQVLEVPAGPHERF